VSAVPRRAQAGPHGRGPTHERSCEFVLAEDPGDDCADGIIGTSLERRDAIEHRRARRRAATKRRRRRQRQRRRQLPNGETLLNTEQARRRHAHQHCARRDRQQHRTEHQPRRCSFSTGPAAGEDRAGGNQQQARLDQRPTPRQAARAKAGRGLTAGASTLDPSPLPCRRTPGRMPRTALPPARPGGNSDQQ